MDSREHRYLFERTKFHGPLLWFSGLMVVSALIATGGLLFDDRVITGAPAWAKPLKFSLSFILYGITLAVLLPLLRKGRRIGWWMGTVITVASVIEMAIIVGQVVRGRASHFNMSTEFDGWLFRVMGATIVVLWIATFVIGVYLWRQPIKDRAITWGVRLAMAIGLIGLGTGFLMTVPTAEQMATGATDVLGAHSVGVPDGGDGLPLLNWSTTGGDLRIGHFVGMHALQLLPLAAFALAWYGRRSSRLADETVRVRTIWVIAAGYLGLTGLVVWQALRGEPLIHPSALTLVVAVALALFTVAGFLWALRGSTTDDGEEPPTRDPVGTGRGTG